MLPRATCGCKRSNAVFRHCSKTTNVLLLDTHSVYKLRNFRPFTTSTTSASHDQQSLKEEYASSPFRSTSGTSIDPVFDPDSIAQPESEHSPIPTSRRFNDTSKLQQAFHETQLEQFKDTESSIDEKDIGDDDLELHLDGLDDGKFSDNVQNSRRTTKLPPGWKKRMKKVEKYRGNILDPRDRPIIRKKRIFEAGEQCEGCGAKLQNTDPDQIGYVDQVQTNEKQSSHVVHNGLEENEDATSTESEIDPNTEMKDIYIPDHQRLLLMDLGIMEKNQKYLTYGQYMKIQEGNKKANKKKDRKTVLEKAICARCYQLENYKKIQRFKDNTIIPKEFTELLTKRFSQNKVNLQQICIIKIVDIFDFHGTFIPNLQDIIRGKNNKSRTQNEQQIKEIPIILALNKVDLLTENVRKPVNHEIIIEWAWNECRRFNFEPYAIITICAKSGHNVDVLLDTACKAAPIRTSLRKHPDLSTAERYRDIYVIGTTNVGKSTLINHLIRRKLIYSPKLKVKPRYLTTSAIPATTMGIMPFIVKDQLNTRLLDTPGVINENNLCLKLTDDEYKMLLLKKSVKPVTYKIRSGQCIILGSLARLDCDVIEDEQQRDSRLLADGIDEEQTRSTRRRRNEPPYFYFTVFVPPMCSVHVGKIERAEELVKLHSGSLFKPVIGIERTLEDPSLNMEKKQTWNLKGIGLQCAMCDVAFPGVGWVALTGSGNNRIQVTAHAIKDMKVGVRKPLLPRDMYRNVKKYSGIPHKKW